MAARTAEDIIKDAIADGLGLDRNDIQSDVRDEAIARYNKCGRILWDRYLWPHRRIDQFVRGNATYVSAWDAPNRIITFTNLVDQILAIRVIGSDDQSGVAMFTQDQVAAARNAKEIESGRFTFLSHVDSTGDQLVRIKMSGDDTETDFNILATLKFVAITSSDYTTARWVIEDLDPALTAYMSDELRSWDGQRIKGDWAGLFEIAKLKAQVQSPVDEQFIPESPAYTEVGNWY